MCLSYKNTFCHTTILISVLLFVIRGVLFLEKKYFCITRFLNIQMSTVRVQVLSKVLNAWILNGMLPLGTGVTVGFSNWFVLTVLELDPQKKKNHIFLVKTKKVNQLCKTSLLTPALKTSSVDEVKDFRGWWIWNWNSAVSFFWSEWEYRRELDIESVLSIEDTLVLRAFS